MELTKSENRYSRIVAFIHEEHRTTPEEHETHTRQTEEEEISSTEGVDSPDCGEGKDAVISSDFAKYVPDLRVD